MSSAIKSSIAYQKLAERFGEITKTELVALAEVIVLHLNIDITAEDKKSIESIYKWYDDNFELIWLFIEEHILVKTEDGKII